MQSTYSGFWFISLAMNIFECFEQCGSPCMWNQAHRGAQLHEGQGTATMISGAHGSPWLT